MTGPAHPPYGPAVDHWSDQPAPAPAVLGPSADPEIGEPPPGPGVRAPFAVPPTERDRNRMWIGLAIGAVALVLCGVGGIAGLAALVVSSQAATVNEATTVVNTYLDALRGRDYGTAYDQLCEPVRRRESAAAFAGRQREQPDIDGYAVGKPRTSGSTVLVPATIRYADGSRGQPEFELVQQGPADLRICGVRQ